MLVGVLATLLAGVIGLVVGMLAGYFGGWIDAVLSRIIDIVLGIPFLLGAIVLAKRLAAGPSDTGSWPVIARPGRPRLDHRGPGHARRR